MNRAISDDLKVIHLLQSFANAICRAVMQHVTRFQVTQRIVLSLGDN